MSPSHVGWEPRYWVLLEDGGLLIGLDPLLEQGVGLEQGVFGVVLNPTALAGEQIFVQPSLWAEVNSQYKRRVSLPSPPPASSTSAPQG